MEIGTPEHVKFYKSLQAKKEKERRDIVRNAYKGGYKLPLTFSQLFDICIGKGISRRVMMKVYDPSNN